MHQATLSALAADLVSGDLPAGGLLGWLVSGGLGGGFAFLWRRMEAQTAEARAFHASVAKAAEQDKAETLAEANERLATLRADMEDRYQRMRAMLEDQLDYTRRCLAECEEGKQQVQAELVALRAVVDDIRRRS